MQSIIETPNLGPVTTSKYLIERFARWYDGDIEEASRRVKCILQSPEIDRLEIPSAVAKSMIANGDDLNCLEFWVHRDSSTVFLVIPTENGKRVDSVLKANMDDFVFDTP